MKVGSQCQRSSKTRPVVLFESRSPNHDGSVITRLGGSRSWALMIVGAIVSAIVADLLPEVVGASSQRPPPLGPSHQRRRWATPVPTDCTSHVLAHAVTHRRYPSLDQDWPAPAESTAVGHGRQPLCESDLSQSQALVAFRMVRLCCLTDP